MEGENNEAAACYQQEAASHKYHSMNMKNASALLSRLRPCQPRKNLTGMRFGKLLVDACLGAPPSGKSHWLCCCDCGEAAVVDSGSMKSGKTQSCGCHNYQTMLHGPKSSTHGYSNSKDKIKRGTYSCWSSMKDRCMNPSSKDFYRYGGRGITVCERWKSFEGFIEDMGQRPSLYHSLDRYPDQEGSYRPGNVRWALMSQQGNNRRSNRMLGMGNKVWTAAELLNLLGGNYICARNLLSKAIKRGDTHFTWQGATITILPKL